MENINMQISDENTLYVYKRFPLVLDHGEGMYLFDENGKKYLDFTAGIAVNSLGHSHTLFTKAIKEQVDKLCHTSNLYYSKAAAYGAQALKQVSGMDKVFFTNSGAEAIEGALKVARKYAFEKKSGRYEIIAMENSFHGRTLGALSVTCQKSYQEPFEPLLSGVKVAKYNDLDSVKSLVNEKTCVIILEPIQGEGGLDIATKDFLQGLRELCDTEDILLIFDEIQCGMGRSGSYFVWQKMGVKPDVLAMAKGIGNGLPVGAFAVTEKVAAASLVPGDHGTTYGGNPLVCTAVSQVIAIIEKENVLENVRNMSAYLEEKLEGLVANHQIVSRRKGTGLMQGLELLKPVAPYVDKGIEKGLLIISAGANILRFVPPLILKKEHIDEMMAILEKILLK